jgi:hypothetical protein
MWYKNEDNDKLRLAVAPNASGPYQGFEAFDDSTYALEGPSVYQTGASSWAMLADAYDNNTAYVFTSDNPKDFQSSISQATNVVTAHSYHHGCVTPITEEEYNEIRNLKTAVRFINGSALIRKILFGVTARKPLMIMASAQCNTPLRIAAAQCPQMTERSD